MLNSYTAPRVAFTCRSVPLSCSTTMATVGVLKDRFRRLEAAGQEEPELSMASMCRTLRRGDAAKFFLQLCVCKSAGFVGLDQARPYGDISISQGPMLV